MLGTAIESIEATEDRAIFRDKVEEIGERVAPSAAAFTVQVGRLGCCCYVFVAFFKSRVEASGMLKPSPRNVATSVG